MSGGPGLRHELNNVLAKIMGAAELALDQPMPDAVQDELRRILAFVENGAEIVRRLDLPASPAGT
jgi:hypothetical protein